MEGFVSILHNFKQNLDVMKSFIESLDRMMEFHKTEDSHKNEHNGFEPIFEAMALVKKESSLESREILIKKINEDFELGEISLNEDKGIKFNFTSSLIANRFNRHINQLLLPDKQISMIYSSSLINLVIYFELLANQLIKVRLKKFPESMNLKEKKLNFKEIEEIGSIREAKNYLIEQEVINLMSSGFVTWMDYFKNKMKVDMKRLSPYINEINEIFCRRHLFVHNDGIVSNTYLSRVGEEFKNDLSIGDKLSVNEKYLLDALDKFKKFGVLLTIETWKRQEKVSSKRQHFLHDYVYDLLVEEEWELASIICEFILTDNEISSNSKYSAKLNFWLAKKRMNQFDSYIDEIKKADFQALNPQFQICRYALLEEYDDLYELLDRNYANPIGMESLEEWPIFAELRKHENYESFIKSKESLEGNTEVLIYN
ncbi:hypothetical protein [Bacillus halotolerans]|uniref:hypothetical protein n=1 Tax=Bacillus halotolerans TaxID=260554 RepID=UPI0037D1666D